jgi:hypothetical protein
MISNLTALVLLLQRQFDLEMRSGIAGVFALDVSCAAAVPGRDAGHDRQPEAGAAMMPLT